MGITLQACRATHVYLIQPEAGSLIDATQLDRVCEKLLADPVTERAQRGVSVGSANTQLIEVHPLPGVMDPVALSVQHAIQELLGLAHAPKVSTGWRYDLLAPGLTKSQAVELANRALANPVIQRVYSEAFTPDRFPESQAHQGGMGEIPLIGLNEEALTRLSRDAHLFLSLDEMLALQAHYTSIKRNPREIELETLAQTWSEHCVHKTLKSTIRYRRHQASGTGRQENQSHADPIRWEGRPGHELQPDGSIIIHNLLKSTVAAATKRLIAEGVDWTLSVFVDNSGVIAFDDDTAVCIKVETHNHPSAIEPYGGAATGIGGCIRDVIATGLGARPIANTDVFCVAFPLSGDAPATSGALQPVPEGCLQPERVLSQVVAGVRDYGNRMGIPTVNGAVYFDERYIGNPLVYCGCIGVMPRDRVKGLVREGDLIVALGGRTGRDGIHGATFSSAELEHSAADEFSHAVQIGNAITEKQTLDAIMRARDEFGEPLYTGMTDCGAGGFSSAIGEMGKETGATVHLDRAPLKYAGLSPTEIWISEAQERFVLSVPGANIDALRTICHEEGVEMAVLGEFAPPPTHAPQDQTPGVIEDGPDLSLMFHGREVGRLSMHLMHEGIPTPHREAEWRAPTVPVRSGERSPATIAKPDLSRTLLDLLAHPNIASKHWIVRQYDHEVRGATAIKPLVGPLSRGPGDASVVCPVAGSSRALAIACGLQTGLGDPLVGGDPYLMTLSAIDECVRNLVCVGADPARIAILDNFCWPSCKKPENLASLVRAAEGCYDGAMAYRTPFVSGKDSLNNQFTTRNGVTIEIPPTLLITGIGIVPDLALACTMDAKTPGNVLLLVGDTTRELGGSHYQHLLSRQGAGLEGDLTRVPRTDLSRGPLIARTVAGLIGDEKRLIASAHDVSDGGLLCAIAEMLIAGSSPSSPIGASVDLSMVSGEPVVAAFGESPSRYVLEVPPGHLASVLSTLRSARVSCAIVATLDSTGTLSASKGLFEAIEVERLARAWMQPLDF